MSNFFGTDGIRGVYGKEVTPEIAFNLGRSIALICSKNFLRKNGVPPPAKRELTGKTIVVGYDTRTSCGVLFHSVVSGILSQGVNVVNLGLVTTPAVSFVARKYKYGFGVMLTASHNSAEYNGIKLFNELGLKLSKKQEERVTVTYENINSYAYEKFDCLGRLYNKRSLVEEYVEYIKSFIKDAFFDYKVCFDCSNGAASRFAKAVFADKFNKVTFLNTSNDGLLVNKACGAADLNCLRQFVLNNKYDFGFAFDGDADRIMLADAESNVLDGDDIMAILTEYFLSINKLKTKTVVGTIITNKGLETHLNTLGVNLLRTDVGDKYVSECLVKNKLQLGGEPAGHIILADYNATGDGLMCAAILLTAFKTAESVKYLLTRKIKLPQYSVNVKVDNNKKQAIIKDEKLKNAVKKYQRQLGGGARIIVRPSGTEPIIRIMIEGEDEGLIKKVLKELEQIILN